MRGLRNFLSAILLIISLAGAGFLLIELVQVYFKLWPNLFDAEYAVEIPEVYRTEKGWLMMIFPAAFFAVATFIRSFRSFSVLLIAAGGMNAFVYMLILFLVLYIKIFN